MTLHLHPEFIPGCYRCDLSRDEAETISAEQAACHHPTVTCDDCGAETHAVLALIPPQRCAPTEDEVAAAIEGADWPEQPGESRSLDTPGSYRRRARERRMQREAGGR